LLAVLSCLQEGSLAAEDASAVAAVISSVLAAAKPEEVG
jgi:hypothetical protein